MQKIYLDYNATAPIFPAVIERVAETMAQVGNASSVHSFGRGARKIVEDARAQVASLAGVRAAQVIFNSGATEGNNTVLSGYRDKAVLVGASEHPSVLEAAPHAHKIPLNRNGIVTPDSLIQALKEHRPALVSLQYVNSETGIVQDIAALAGLVKEHGALFHCDAVQAAGRLALDFKTLNVDYLTLSAHKFGGPQGTGALIFREALQIPKFIHGGGQEKRQRAGTENVAAIAGFGRAAELAVQGLKHYQTHTKAIQEKLESALCALSDKITIVGQEAARVTNTSSILLKGISAETQLMAMDLEGICVSSGSACSSGTFKPSHVLAAMGYDAELAKSALRFSYGYATTISEIDAAITAYGRMMARIKG